MGKMTKIMTETYHVGRCHNCEATVNLADEEFDKIHGECGCVALYLDRNLECCHHPNFLWTSVTTILKEEEQIQMTREQAIEEAIKHWEWVVETGRHKADYPKAQDWRNHCALCSYTYGDCPTCPYYQRFGGCASDGTPYRKWGDSYPRSPEEASAARLLLAQLYSLREDKKCEKHPEPKFKVGDRVKSSSWSDNHEPLTIRATPIWEQGNNEGKGSWEYRVNETGYFYNELWLTLAPKEEWVDVTRECDVRIVNNAGTPMYYIKVSHNDSRILSIGNKVEDFRDPWYKVELQDDDVFHYECGGFRVYKKVNNG